MWLGYSVVLPSSHGGTGSALDRAPSTGALLVFSAPGHAVASPRTWGPTHVGSFATSDGLAEPTDPQAPLSPTALPFRIQGRPITPAPCSLGGKQGTSRLQRHNWVRVPNSRASASASAWDGDDLPCGAGGVVGVSLKAAVAVTDGSEPPGVCRQGLPSGRVLRPGLARAGF